MTLIKKRIRLLVIAMALSIAPVGFSTAVGQANPDWPDWLNKAAAKETKKLKGKNFELGDSGIEIRMPGKKHSKPEKSDDFWYVSSSIGGNGVLECYVYLKEVDLAVSTKNVAALLIELAVAANEQSELGVQEVTLVDAGAIAQAPFLALERMYTVNVGSETRVGQAKVRFAKKDGRAVSCTHNGLGYSDTFARAFDEFVTTSKFTPQEDPPYFEEIAVQTIGDTNVGIVRVTMTRDEDGDTLTNAQAAMLVPVDKNTIRSTDSVDYSYSRPDGSFLNAGSVSVTDGNEDFDLDLRFTDDQWAISGESQGQVVSAALGPVAEPESQRSQYRKVAALIEASPDVTQIEFVLWVPSISPTELIKGTFSVLPDQRKQRRGVMALGPLEMPVGFNDDGMIVESLHSIAGTEIRTRQVFVSGAFD